VEPTAVALLTKGFKWELLTWWGIIGGAVTLFTALSAVLKLADWARVLVQHWKEWTHAFWVWAFGWVGIHVPRAWAPVLSFLLFGSLLTIGQAVKFKITIKDKPIVDNYQGKSFDLISWPAVLVLCAVCILIYGAYVSGPIFSLYFVQDAVLVPIIVLLFARYRLHAAITIVLLQRDRRATRASQNHT